MRTLRLTLGAAVILMLLGTASIFGPPADAKQPECRVENLSGGGKYNSNTHANPLQAAINEAARGATLRVIGVCSGHFRVYEDITLTGRMSKKHNDVLDGRGTGQVLAVGDHFMPTTVEVAHLTIRNGKSSSGGGIGVSEGSTLKLTHSIVTGNDATWGGGIDFSGDVRLKNSVVRNNDAKYYGGGIHSSFGGSIRLVDTTVTGNSAGTGGGGVAMLKNSQMVATDSIISKNRVGGGANGGGIYSYVGWVTISSTKVTGNSAGYGGGIFNHGGVVFLYENSGVRDNEAVDGGGIFNSNHLFGGGPIQGGIVGMHSGKVVGNTASRYGGGIYNEHDGDVELVDTTVTSNVAGTAGGGIWNVKPGTVELKGTTDACGNKPDDWPGC